MTGQQILEALDAVDALLEQLDAEARRVGGAEYGLPWERSVDGRDGLRAVVFRWFDAIEEKNRSTNSELFNGRVT